MPRRGQRAREDHPWKMRDHTSETAWHRAERRVKKNVERKAYRRNPPESSRGGAWVCPQCASPDCEFGECLV